jgi:eukaryotic-like serine/threonine-protein kinase
MAAPVSTSELVALMRQSGVVSSARLETGLPDLPDDPEVAARVLIREGWLTYFHAEQLLKGRWHGFTIGKYQILERLGCGGMGVVYLAEHLILERRVAIKVLPPHLAKESWFLDRFYREAQAVAALSHPNIVHAHDVDHDDAFHFLVMEYVDGASLQQIVHEHGPLSVTRAAHYVRQVARGLEHARQAGLVHRDVKPGNLLLDRQGTVKILDLGLACFQDSQRKSQAKPSERVMVGTDDYLAPEQIVDSDAVDARADIYGLGATFYYLLSGSPPFPEAPSPSLKLIWHLTKSPRPIREIRSDVPEAMEALLVRMMAKNPWERPQTPAEIDEALEFFTRQPIEPPPSKEMPQLSPALRVGRGPGVAQGGGSSRRSRVLGMQGSSSALQATPPPGQAPTAMRNGAGTPRSDAAAESLPPRF